MQIDLRAAELPAEALRTEVCIVGAGIAGILLAHTLARAGKEVVLLEAGALTPDVAALHPPPDPRIGYDPGWPHDGRRIEMPGYVHPGSAGPALEAFGGTSLTWGGQLLPLPEGVAGTTWPIMPAQLAPYYAEAEQVLGVDSLSYEGPAFLEAAHAPSPPLFSSIAETTLRVSKFAPFSHRNLTQTLGRALLRQTRVRVVLNARATEFLPKRSGDYPATCVGAVAAKLPTGESFRIEAKEFIVAAGTLETVRLLLASRSIDPRGLGNEHGQLGRHVHDHLTLTAAAFTEPSRELVLEQLRPWIVRGSQGMTVHGFKLEASLDLRQRLELHSVMAHLTLEEPEGSPIGALRARLRSRQGKGTEGLLRGSLRQLPSALAEAARLAWWAGVHKRRYVSAQATVALRLNSAQSTPSQSTITLSDKLDDLGQPKAVLRWMIESGECATLLRFAAYLRDALGDLGSDPGVHWTPSLFAPESSGTDRLIGDLTDARHLMGGALMGADPRTSVVDADLRVHGVANLHVASLATFPDGSAQLPTLTLMALALRLAERLSR